MRISHRRVVLLGAALFAGGLFLVGGPGLPQELTPEEARENPDLPGFLDGQIDMEEYLRLRSDATAEHRGLPYAPGKKGAANPRAAAIAKMEAQQQLRLQALTPGGLPPASWESVGPAPIPNGQTSTRSDPVSGRATAIAVHPTNPNKVYVGTAQGGVYRSLDGGATWTAIFDGAQSLAIGALAISPSNPSIVYVGTGEPNLSADSFFGVGLYRIDNAETTADLTGPINPAVTTGIAGTTAFTGRAISKILVHPTNPGIIFVATSTGIAGLGATAIEAPTAVPPLAVLGLYRSMDATTASPSFEKLVVTNVSGTRLLAGDARSENSRVVDLVFDPGDPNILVAAVYGGPAQGGIFNEGGIYRSTNALSTPALPTFTKATAAIATLNNAVRVSLAANKVGSTVTVVAATGESASFAGSSCTTGSGAVRKSTDGGVTWSARLPGGAGFCGSQCFYDLPIEIDPTDANLVHIGGASNSTCSRTYTRSTDGGATFVQTDDGLHADAHAIVAAPSNPTIVYEANDGGIWKSTDSGLTWQSLNNSGFNATQFQSLALHPVDREFMIGGTQDNGTEFKRPDATWTRADFGDGGFALVDQSATDTEDVTMYHTYFNQTNAMGYGRVTKASDAFENNWTFLGCGFVAGTNGLNCSPAATSILFYAPMALGPGTPNPLYFGSDRLFRSSNQGTTMALASQGPLQSGVAVSAIGVSPQSDNVRLVGMRLGKVFATATGAAILTDVTGPWPVSASLASQPRRFVARTVIDPNDSNVAYVTFATYCAANGIPTPGCAPVYKTTNLVSALLAATLPTWTAASSGIPDVPVNAFVVDPRNSNNLFAGTDIGVYNSTDGGLTWAPYGTGFPRVAVFDLALHRPSGTLRAATHGRGIWEIAAGNASPVFSGLAAPTIGLGGSPTLLFGALAAGSLIPPGSVDITLNGVTQSATIDAGTGLFSSSFDTSALPAAAYPIAYSFAGATGYNAATGSGTLTVDAALTPTTTTLTAPIAPFPDASVTVTVTSPSGTPTGNVTLKVDGGAPLTQVLSGGAATFPLPAVEAGTHSLLATYGVNAPFGGSAAAGSLTVTKGAAAFTVASPRIAAGQTPSLLGGTLLVAGAAPTGSVDITLGAVTQSAAIDPVTGAFSSSFATGALAAGTYPIGLSYAGDANFDPSTGSGILVVTATVTTTTFSNSAAITINDVAPGSPYPSVINVSGLFGKVLKATVTLKGVSHTFFSDTAFLLVGPDGQTTALLYHAGPQTGAIAGASNIDITLDDSGVAFPTATAPASGTYEPTQSAAVNDFDTGGSPGPDPPLAPYGTVLFTHNGTNPNGAWRLYVQDDFAGDVGGVAAGWDLTLTTAVEPAVSISDASAVAEGGDAVFTVTLSSPPAFPVDVDFATASGTATSGADFALTSGTLTFGALETSKTITVPTVDDIDDEPPSETFFVDLSNPQNATLGDAQGQGTILDDDPFASINDVRKPEGSSGTTSFTFTVSLTAPPISTVSVKYATVSLGATAGVDYTPVSGVLSFSPGQASRTITVPVRGDRLEEMDEFFKVVLTSPNGLILVKEEGLGWIVNDDFVGLPRISISDANLIEGNSGTSNMVFTVTLSRVSSSVVAVRYATANGTATAGSDYTATTGILTFPVGTTQRTLSVPVIGDTVLEPDETFFVDLSQPRGGALLDKQGKGTIVNDD